MLERIAQVRVLQLQDRHAGTGLPQYQGASLVAVLVLGRFALLRAHHIHHALNCPSADDNDLTPVCCKVPLGQLRLRA